MKISEMLEGSDVAGTWRSITRRMIQAVQERFGMVVVTVRVVVINGKPILWTKPSVKAYEPRSAVDLEQLTPDQLAQVIEWDM